MQRRKQQLAERSKQNVRTYSLGKNDIMREILEKAGWTKDEAEEKERQSEIVWPSDAEYWYDSS